MAFIEIDNLKFDYLDENGEPHTVLSGVDLKVERGEFVAVVGRNGSGKSTLSKHLNAVLIPASGSVRIDGMDTSDEGLVFDVRQKVGLVFQNPDNQIVSTVVEEDVAFAPENMGMPRELIIERVDYALHAVGMEEYRLHAPHLLSGGQKQRIAIAGILAMRPECVVLDEPTAMLDPSGRVEIMEIIGKLNSEEGITVILVTHFMEEAAKASRVIVMDEGRIILDGSAREVFSCDEVIERAGLELPQVTKFAKELRTAGIPIEPGILTVGECAVELARVLGDLNWE